METSSEHVIYVTIRYVCGHSISVLVQFDMNLSQNFVDFIECTVM